MTTPDAPREVWVTPKLGAAWATGVLHAMRTSCEVIGRTHTARYVRADLASVPSGDTEPVEAENERLRTCLSELLIYARGNKVVLSKIHAALDGGRR